MARTVDTATATGIGAGAGAALAAFIAAIKALTAKNGNGGKPKRESQAQAIGRLADAMDHHTSQEKHYSELTLSALNRISEGIQRLLGRSDSSRL